MKRKVLAFFALLALSSGASASRWYMGYFDGVTSWHGSPAGVCSIHAQRGNSDGERRFECGESVEQARGGFYYLTTYWPDGRVDTAGWYGVSFIDCDAIPSPTSPWCGGAGPENAGKQDCSIMEGNPVNVLVGNKYQRVEDIPKYNSKLHLSRSYNSRYNTSDPYRGLMRNWQHNYDARLIISGSLTAPKNVIAQRADGRQHLYTVGTDGNWQGPKKIQLEQIVNAQGSVDGWRVKEALTEELYSQAGYITEIVDKQSGESLHFVHDETKGVLERVEDERGQFLTFSYNEAGALMMVAHSAGPSVQYAYNENNMLSSATYADGTTELYHYEVSGANHLLTAVTDRRGVRFVEWSYDSSWRATASRHFADGQPVDEYVFNYFYDSDFSNPRVYVKNPLGRVSYYHFEVIDNQRKLKKIDGLASAGCAAANRQYSYTADGLVDTVTNWAGVKTQYTYNDRGLKTSVIDAVDTPSALTTQTQWHPEYDLPVEVIKPNATTSYSYTPNGLIDSVTVSADGVSRLTRYEYNANQQLVSIDGPRDDVSDKTWFSYDSNRNLSSITNSIGHTTSFGDYDALGRAGYATDANGIKTVLTYHPQGWVKSVERQHPSGELSLSQTTLYGYDEIGQVTAITQPDGQLIRFEYDSARRLSAITSHSGDRHEFIYDAAGNLVKESIRDSSQSIVYHVQRSFDELSRLRSVLTGSGQLTQYNYDVSNNLSETIDGRGAIHGFNFDALDRISKVIDPLLNPTEYSYNKQGDISHVSDAKGLTTQYIYNGHGEITQQISPDTGITRYSYDSAGNRISKEDARGQTTHYRYDALNRLIAVEYLGDESFSETYVYDEPGDFTLGRLTQTRDNTGVTYINYGPFGDLVGKYYTVGENAYAQRYNYDSQGRLTATIYPSGRHILYEYDSQGRIVRVATKSNALAPLVNVVTDVSYLPFGPVISWVYGNGIKHIREFDQGYRLTRLNNLGLTLSLDADYAYDESGNISAIESLLDPAKSQAFVYDQLNRLTGAVGNYGDVSYTYDAVGNRLSRSVSQQEEIYQYSTDSHRLHSVTDSGGVVRNFSYDANGNLIADARSGGIQWQYNVQNRPETLTINSRPVKYSHNLMGQRVVQESSTGKKVFHYGLGGKLLAVDNGMGSVAEEYIWLGDLLVGSLMGEVSQETYPQFQVLTPGLDVQIDSATALQLNGTAMDNGNDISASIIWESDLDGELAIGANAQVSGLSIGQHRISAKVQSGAGKTSRLTRLVRVTEAVAATNSAFNEENVQLVHIEAADKEIK